MANVSSLSGALNDDGPALFYRADFRNVLEYHMEFLRSRGNAYPITVEPHIAYKYEYDFTGLMLHYNIPRHLHWVIMRLNGFTSPLEYRADVLLLLGPDPKLLDQLMNTHSTVQSIS